MGNLYVRTILDEMIIKDIQPTDIKEVDGYIVFGEKAKVKKDCFVSYQFVDNE
jgi:hypothetical protein